MPATNNAKASMLDTLLGMSGVTVLGLFTVDPGVSGASSGEMPFADGYDRRPIDWAAAIQGATTTKANLSAIVFPAATANWAPFTHYAAIDTLGFIVWTWSIGFAGAVNTGNVWVINAGGLVATLRNE